MLEFGFCIVFCYIKYMFIENKNKKVTFISNET